MAVVHRFDLPDRFVAGTGGEPGSRTFFLQARQAQRLVSIALEKQQVALLAERVDELLDEVAEAAPDAVPAMAPLGLVDNDPLDSPIEAEFRAGTMTLSWDPSQSRVVIEVFAFDESAIDLQEADDLGVPGPVAEEEAEPPEMVLVMLAAGQARAFAQRALQVVGAGREACPFCGGPIDVSGHLCPRANGFRRRDP